MESFSEDAEAGYNCCYFLEDAPTVQASSYAHFVDRSQGSKSPVMSYVNEPLSENENEKKNSAIYSDTYFSSKKYSNINYFHDVNKNVDEKCCSRKLTDPARKLHISGIESTENTNKNARNISSSNERELLRKTGYESGLDIEYSSGSEDMYSSDLKITQNNLKFNRELSRVPPQNRQRNSRMLPFSSGSDYSDCISHKDYEISHIIHKPIRLSHIFSDSQYVTMKQRQLEEKAQRLKITEENVRQQEVAAQEKFCQALKEREELLSKMEESLKFRQIIAQRQLREASQFLETSKELNYNKKLNYQRSNISSELLKEELFEDDISLFSSTSDDLKTTKNSDKLDTNYVVDIIPQSKSMNSNYMSSVRGINKNYGRKRKIFTCYESNNDPLPSSNVVEKLSQKILKKLHVESFPSDNTLGVCHRSQFGSLSTPFHEEIVTCETGTITITCLGKSNKRSSFCGHSSLTSYSRKGRKLLHSPQLPTASPLHSDDDQFSIEKFDGCSGIEANQENNFSSIEKCQSTSGQNLQQIKKVLADASLFGYNNEYFSKQKAKNADKISFRISDQEKKNYKCTNDLEIKHNAQENAFKNTIITENYIEFEKAGSSVENLVNTSPVIFSDSPKDVDEKEKSYINSELDEKEKSYINSELPCRITNKNLSNELNSDRFDERLKGEWYGSLSQHDDNAKYNSKSCNSNLFDQNEKNDQVFMKICRENSGAKKQSIDGNSPLYKSNGNLSRCIDFKISDSPKCSLPVIKMKYFSDTNDHKELQNHDSCLSTDLVVSDVENFTSSVSNYTQNLTELDISHDACIEVESDGGSDHQCVPIERDHKETCETVISADSNCTSYSSLFTRPQYPNPNSSYIDNGKSSEMTTNINCSIISNSLSLISNTENKISSTLCITDPLALSHDSGNSAINMSFPSHNSINNGEFRSANNDCESNDYKYLSAGDVGNGNMEMETINICAKQLEEDESENDLDLSDHSHGDIMDEKLNSFECFRQDDLDLSGHFHGDMDEKLNSSECIRQNDLDLSNHSHGDMMDEKLNSSECIKQNDLDLSDHSHGDMIDERLNSSEYIRQNDLNLSDHSRGDMMDEKSNSSEYNELNDDAQIVLAANLTENNAEEIGINLLDDSEISNEKSGCNDVKNNLPYVRVPKEDSPTNNGQSFSKNLEPAKKKRGRGQRLCKNLDFEDLMCIERANISKNGYIECGKCDLKFTNVEEFKDHSFKKHCGLARAKGVEEFDEDTILLILKSVFKKYKKLNCDFCRKIFRSIGGFLYHIQTCGKSFEERFTVCDICKMKILITSLEKHRERHFTKQNENKSQKNKGEPVYDEYDFDKPRKKRRAAEACHIHMKKLYSSISGNQGDSDEDREWKMEMKFENFFSRNFRSESELDINYQEFTEILQRDGKISCPNLSCEFSFKSIPKLKRHITNCMTNNVNFVCQLCKLSLKKENLESHVRSYHADQLSDSEDDEEEENDNNDELKERVKTDDKVCLYVFPKSNTLDFRKVNYSDKLFCESQCRKEDWVELCHINKYIPKIQISPSFTFNIDSSHSTAWNKLPLFGSVKEDEMGELFYVGGPIVSSAWCPINNCDKSSVQYVALSCANDPDHELAVSRCEKGDGLIQLWNCGSHDNSEAPIFSLGIAHEFGMAWSMEWCPSGVYETPNKNGNVHLNRLGMLVVAFSDGIVRIFTIPHPNQLISKTKIFKKLPDVSLCPYINPDNQFHCLKVSWCHSKGHNLIASSFSNGMVCVWDILFANFEFSDKIIDKCLYPINTIYAHNGICTAVSFCPQTNGQHIVTGGGDRTLKFWDLSLPEQPLSVLKRGIVTDTAWLPHWAGCFVSFEEENLEKTNTCFRESGFYEYLPRSVIGTNSAVWSISGSDWFNSIVQVNDSGEVYISAQKNIFSYDKYSYKRKLHLFTVQLEALSNNLSSSDYLSNLNHTDYSENLENSVNKSEFSQLYSDAAENYGIKICDNNYMSVSKKHKIVCANVNPERMKPGPITTYPLMGASTASWNNNFGYHKWIFVGMNSGLARIVRAPFLENLR